MAQLWGGRFTKETDQLVYNFNASISFDKRFYEQDIRGSIAHVTMLAKQEILTDESEETVLCAEEDGYTSAGGNGAAVLFFLVLSLREL